MINCSQSNRVLTVSKLSFFRQRSLLCRVGQVLQAYEWSAGFYRSSSPLLDAESGMVVNLSIVDQWMQSVITQASADVSGEFSQSIFNNEKELLQFLHSSLQKQMSVLASSVAISNIQIKDLYGWNWQLQFEDGVEVIKVSLPFVFRYQTQPSTTEQGVAGANSSINQSMFSSPSFLRSGTVCFFVDDVDLFLKLRGQQRLLQVDMKFEDFVAAGSGEKEIYNKGSCAEVFNKKDVNSKEFNSADKKSSSTNSESNVFYEDCFWQKLQHMLLARMKTENPLFEIAALAQSVLSIELQDQVSKKSDRYFYK